MTSTDPIADLLTQIRNAIAVRQNHVLIPSSRMKQAIAQVLKDEGYISRYEVTRGGRARGASRFPMLKIYIKYAPVGESKKKEPVLKSLRRISRPGCRVYARRREIPWVKSGLGTVILSTPRGVVSGREARRLRVGGEVLCEVW